MHVVSGGVGDLLAGYSRLNAHIGGMLHSCILAASTGTPCIGLSYDIKHAGFFKALDLSNLCVPTVPWPSDLIFETVLDVLAREAELRRHIQQRREAFRSKALGFLVDALPTVMHGA
jgi:polysaccharide pyruvyl transferase WcaK-like protein